MYSAIVWSVLVVVFLVIEACTYQMVSTWFAIGSAIAAVIAYFGGEVTWQIALFLVVSAACLAALRPLSLKSLKGKNIRTNAESLIGETVLVTENVDNIAGKGTGKIRGMEWTLRSENGEVISSGERVCVKKIEGVKLIVASTKGE